MDNKNEANMINKNINENSIITMVLWIVAIFIWILVCFVSICSFFVTDAVTCGEDPIGMICILISTISMAVYYGCILRQNRSSDNQMSYSVSDTHF